MKGLVLHVRQGFENDAANELQYHFQSVKIEPKSITAKTDTAIVFAELSENSFAIACAHIKYDSLLFARQLLWLTGEVALPHEGDRATCLVDFIQNNLLDVVNTNAFSGFAFETADTDEAKELTGFCKSLSRPIENSLNKLKLLPKGKGAAHLPRIHLLMMNHRSVFVCFTDPKNSNTWPMGIPRLKFPANAPSRSTLKLEEAFHVFLGQKNLDQHLKKGMTGVDLGACPGGWTFQLVKHGIYTTAVDNGSIDSKLMSSGLVTHLREDAFTFKPHETVDWMVCDVVEQPAKIADLMAEWIIHNYCRQMIFNLKLPMKKRFEEITQCLEFINKKSSQHHCKLEIRAKQLYHDRKEITVYIRRL